MKEPTMDDHARLSPLQSTDVTDEQAAKLLGRLEDVGKDVHMAHLFVNAPHVFRPYVLMSDALMNRSALAPRLRELVILRLGRRLDAAYEWWEHVRMSQADGVTTAEIAAIEADDLAGGGFGEHDSFVLAATDEWLDGHSRLGDATWQTGVELLGRAAMLDLVFVWAWWGAWVPATVRTLRIEVPGDASWT
jgi:alkylhydroperoxidase family enzyme